MVAVMRTTVGGSSSPLFYFSIGFGFGFFFFLFFHSPSTLKIPRFVPLFLTKNHPPLLVPHLVFISRGGGKDHLTPTMA